MNLLTDPWIMVRPLAGGEPQRITLQMLLCERTQWTPALSRDDMELALIQLLVSLVQVMWIPEDYGQLRARIGNPLNETEFQQGIRPYAEMFCLDHPEHPFMQYPGVEAKILTGMDKLLAGVTGNSCCAFINESGQGKALCSGCTAIALFNQASNAPRFGGGFKDGLRGGAPVTTLIHGNDLRTTLWLNVLCETHLDKQFTNWRALRTQLPVWQQPIQPEERIAAESTGLLRGLFWQPAHISLCPPLTEAGPCSACGAESASRYESFIKEKFRFTFEGRWPHPHSPAITTIKKGVMETRFLSFIQAQPTWTQINRMLLAREEVAGKENRVIIRPAAVMDQLPLITHRTLYLLVGGYRNDQASIMERRHDVLTFKQGWDQKENREIIAEIVNNGKQYRVILRNALRTFVDGMKKHNVKGVGLPLQEVAIRRYYNQASPFITGLLASIDYRSPTENLNSLKAQLRTLCQQIFEDVTRPYAHQPKLILARAHARLHLRNALVKQQPQGEQRNETTT